MTKLLTAKHDPVPKGIPGWHELDAETREEIRLAYIKKWAGKLTQAFGWDSDSDTDGSNRTGNGSEMERR